MKENLRAVVLAVIVFLICYLYLGAIQMNPRYYDIIVDYIYRVVNPFH